MVIRVYLHNDSFWVIVVITGRVLSCFGIYGGIQRWELHSSKLKYLFEGALQNWNDDVKHFLGLIENILYVILEINAVTAQLLRVVF